MSLAEIRSRLPVRVAWVWSVVLIGLVIYAMMYFTFGRVAMEVILSIEASYTFPEPAASVVTVLKYVIALHPLFAMFGWLLWGYIQSSRRSVREYEV